MKPNRKWQVLVCGYLGVFVWPCVNWRINTEHHVSDMLEECSKSAQLKAKKHISLAYFFMHVMRPSHSKELKKALWTKKCLTLFIDTSLVHSTYAKWLHDSFLFLSILSDIFGLSVKFIIIYKCAWHFADIWSTFPTKQHDLAPFFLQWKGTWTKCFEP